MNAPADRAARGILLGLIALVSSGCATMFNPQPQWVEIVATDQGRSVDVDAKISGRRELEAHLPATIPLTPLPWAPTTVAITSECYEPSMTPIVQSMSAATLLNFSNYFIGVLLDINTGAIWNFDERVEIPLRRRPNSVCASTSTDNLVTDGEKKTYLQPSSRKRNHRLALGVGSAFDYSGGKTFNIESSNNGGTSWSYEYSFNDTIGLLVRAGSGSGYVMPASNNAPFSNSYTNISVYSGTLEFVVQHNFRKLRGFQAGVGIGTRNSGVNYTYYNTMTGVENQYSNDREVTYLLLGLGWRTSGTVFVGVDLHLTSPALLLNEYRHPKVSNNIDAIPNAQDRAQVRRLSDNLPFANQLTFSLGLAF